MKDLAQFTSATCWTAKPDRRCREAYLALGRLRERRGAVASVWAAFDRALTAAPRSRRGRRGRTSRAPSTRSPTSCNLAGQGPILIRYRDELPDEYSLRSVTIAIDFAPVVTRDKNAGELHNADFAQIFGGPLPAGQHVLVVEAVH